MTTMSPPRAGMNALSVVRVCRVKEVEVVEVGVFIGCVGL